MWKDMHDTLYDVLNNSYLICILHGQSTIMDLKGLENKNIDWWRL